MKKICILFLCICLVIAYGCGTKEKKIEISNNITSEYKDYHEDLLTEEEKNRRQLFCLGEYWWNLISTAEKLQQANISVEDEKNNKIFDFYSQYFQMCLTTDRRKDAYKSRLKYNRDDNKYRNAFCIGFMEGVRYEMIGYDRYSELKGQKTSYYHPQEDFGKYYDLCVDNKIREKAIPPEENTIHITQIKNKNINKQTNNIQNIQTCIIKGNISFDGEKIYHLPGCESYNDTVINTKYGERWFCSEQEAIQAGRRKARNC